MGWTAEIIPFSCTCFCGEIVGGVVHVLPLLCGLGSTWYVVVGGAMVPAATGRQVPYISLTLSPMSCAGAIYERCSIM